MKEYRQWPTTKTLEIIELIFWLATTIKNLKKKKAKIKTKEILVVLLTWHSTYDTINKL